MNDRVVSNTRRILKIESEAILEQMSNLNDDFFSAAQKIADCRGRVAVMGIGKSGLIGRKIAATLSSVGTPTIFVHPTESMHGDFGMLAHGDIVMILSYSGETEELKKVLPVIKEMKLHIIAMTGRLNSMLAKAADAVISVAVKKEACPFNIIPTASTAAMMSMGDALALTVMDIKGFQKEDFARLHPGGTLGKKLHLKVKDLMHTGEDNPIVSEDCLVRDALFVMTKTRMGAASVVDGKGRLVGAFTDGDLRRKLQDDDKLLDKKLSGVMTRGPHSVTQEMLASDAVKLFRRYRVDNLPVVDDKNKPVGILDEKDLLEEGLI